MSSFVVTPMMAALRGALGALILLAGIGCRQGTAPGDVSPHELASPADLSLKVGDNALVDGDLLISFTGVPSDSRCPASVMCTWAGDAAVVISHGFGRTLALGDTLHSTLDPHGILVGSYFITLTSVAPYPATPGVIRPDQYLIHLKVEHVSSRMYFGKLVPADVALPDPPIVVDYSAQNDTWSKGHETLESLHNSCWSAEGGLRPSALCLRRTSGCGVRRCS